MAAFNAITGLILVFKNEQFGMTTVVDPLRRDGCSGQNWRAKLGFFVITNWGGKGLWMLADFAKSAKRSISFSPFSNLIK